MKNLTGCKLCDGTLEAEREDEPLADWEIEIIDAQIAMKSDRTTWHEDGDGFRKGLWTVEEDELGGFTAQHDDLDGYSYYYLPSSPDRDVLMPGQTDFHARRAVRDLLTWRAADTEPEEPTGLGAVVEAGGVRFVRTSTHNPRWRNGDAGVMWPHISQFGPVTVLSQGVAL